jgi:two-component system phosphate regulon sensor histidine kinase PhoR
VLGEPFRRARWRIAGAYLLLLAITLATLALVGLELLRTTYLGTLQDGLAGQARLLASLLESRPADPATLQATVRDAGVRLGARVTLVDASGVELADSLGLGIGERLLDRPEVRGALGGGQSAIERSSTATGDDRLYVAVPVGPAGARRGAVRVGVPLPAVAEAQAQLGAAIASAALLAGAAAVMLGVLIARRLTQPLLDLRAMAGRLAAGDLDVRVPIPRDAEVAALAQDFNQMASRLRQLLSEVERERRRLEVVLATMADGVAILGPRGEVTMANPAGEAALAGLTEGRSAAALAAELGRLRALPPGAPPVVVEELPGASGRQSLRAQLAQLPPAEAGEVLLVLQDLTELRRAERSRRALMSNIAHDLRTPLASLQAIVETLEDGALADPEAAPDFLRRMGEEVDGMARLVRDVLELSRIESGDLALDLAPADVGAIARSAAARMSEQATRAGLRLAVEVPRGLPQLVLDAPRIEQALLNVLQNALAHTPPGGSITVGANLRGGAVELWVADTGAGISPEDLPHIFERLYKGDPSRGGGGAGLGLAIVRHLVERHGGAVAAESTPGAGATITMRLPAQADPPGQS